MKQVKVNNTIFKAGATKICVPVMGKTFLEVEHEIVQLQELMFDVIEWRIDYLEDEYDENKLADTLKIIKQYHDKKPVIVTFRTAQEGGNKAISEEDYFSMLTNMLEKIELDIIDVEGLKTASMVEKLINLAHKKNVKVILSSHNFDLTPKKSEIIECLSYLQSFGADIIKVAYMPLNDDDVIALLQASIEMKNHIATQPFITISMGEKGVITRIATKLSGSCLTFASAKSISAPGQISANELANIFKIV